MKEKPGQEASGAPRAFASRWFGCYGDPAILLVTDANFGMEGRYEFNCSLGIVGLPGGRFFAARGQCSREKDGCMGRLKLAVPEEASGLRHVEADTDSSGE